MKHNQAKWLIRPSYLEENVYRLWNKDSNYHKDTSPEVMDGNARLMENAPQLLLALNQAIAYIVSPESFDKEVLEQNWRELKARALGN